MVEPKALPLVRKNPRKTREAHEPLLVTLIS